MNATGKTPAMAPRRRALAAIACGLAGAVRPAAAATEAGTVIAWPALTLLDGRTLAAGDWQDTAAVVVFWATWCGFCRRHNARIDRLHRAAAGPHLRVLGIAVDSDAAGARRYMAEHGYGFPVAMAVPGLRERFTSRRVLPTTCLVDRGGHLLQAIPGEMSDEDVLALAALAGPQAA